MSDLPTGHLTWAALAASLESFDYRSEVVLLDVTLYTSALKKGAFIKGHLDGTRWIAVTSIRPMKR